MHFLQLLALLILCAFMHQTSARKCAETRTSGFVAAIVTTDSLDPYVAQHLHIQNGSGYVEKYAPRLGQYACERLGVTALKISNETSIGIYDKGVPEALSKVNFLVGEEIESLRAYVSQKDHHNFYFITSPVGSSMEWRIKREYLLRRKTDGSDRTMTYALWPSITSVINAVVGNVRIFTSNVKAPRRTIFLLFHAQKVDSLLYVDQLASRLKEEKFVVRFHDLYHHSKHMKSDLNFGNEHVYYATKELRAEMEDSHMVVFYADVDLDTKITMLEFLFSKGAQLERENVPWLLADIQLARQMGAMHRLDWLEIMKTRLLLIEPCLFPRRHTKRGFASCLMKKYPEGLARTGLQAGEGLMEELITRPKGQTGMSVLRQQLGVNCKIVKLASGDEDCDSSTIRTVGFPSYDFIVTRQLRPRREQKLAALYFHNSTWSAAPSVLKKSAEDTTESRTYYLKDYVIVGERPSETLEYVVVIPDKPFVIANEDGSYSGLAIDIYNAVRMKMVEQGIILNLHYIEAETYGSYQNGEWSGVFGYLSRDNGESEEEVNGTAGALNSKTTSRAVLGLGQISVTKERTEDGSFKFAPIFAHTAVTYMVRKLDVQDAYLQALRPFTDNVWFALIGVVFVSAAYFRLIDMWNPLQEAIPENARFTWWESVWHSYLTVTQIGAAFGAVPTPARVYSLFYWFFGLVVVGCYTGNLTGFLSESSMISPSLHEHVYNLGYRFGMITNSSVSQGFFKQFFGRTILPIDSLDMVKNYAEGVEKVRNERFILLGTSLIMKTYEVADVKCALSVHGAPYYEQKIEPVAFPMRADWPLAESFFNAMMALKESGDLQLIYRKWISTSNHCILHKSGKKKVHARLGWNNFIGLYLLMLIGAGFSFVILLPKQCLGKILERFGIYVMGQKNEEEEEEENTEKQENDVKKALKPKANKVRRSGVVANGPSQDVVKSAGIPNSVSQDSDCYVPVTWRPRYR